jgi:hypothetical protein
MERFLKGVFFFFFILFFLFATKGEVRAQVCTYETVGNYCKPISCIRAQCTGVCEMTTGGGYTCTEKDPGYLYACKEGNEGQLCNGGICKKVGSEYKCTREEGTTVCEQLGGTCYDKSAGCPDGTVKYTTGSPCHSTNKVCCISNPDNACTNAGGQCQKGGLFGCSAGTEHFGAGDSECASRNPEIPRCCIEQQSSPCKGKKVNASCTHNGLPGTCRYYGDGRSGLYCDVTLHPCDKDHVGQNCDGGICTKVAVSNGGRIVYEYRCEPHPELPDAEKQWWENTYQAPERGIEGMDEEPPTIGGLGDMVTKVINYLFPIAGLVCLVFIIQGGYMWIVSAGNPESLKKAQGTLTWAIIGLVLTMIIFGILTVLLNFLYK